MSAGAATRTPAKSIAEVASRLSHASVQKGISWVLDRVPFPAALDTRRLQFPERLLSLYHHPVYRELTDEQRWNLSLLETASFFSFNIHGERALVRELVARVFRKSSFGSAAAVDEYMQHFVLEETAHTFMLAGYCNRYAGGVMRDVSAPVATPELSPAGDELLLFARTLVLEAFLDYLNRSAMADHDIDETPRVIHRTHHLDETRHMAFDRSVVAACVDRLRHEGRDDEIRTVSGLVATYGRYAIKRLHNPLVYRSIGVEDPVRVSWDLERIEARRRITRDWLSSATAALRSAGLSIEPEEPGEADVAT